jgi:signal transduction histidine kinase
LSPASVLIVADDPEFARAVVARWQLERHVPEITLASSDVWQSSSAPAYQLVIVGPVRQGKSISILAALQRYPGAASVYVPEKDDEDAEVSAENPGVLVLRRQEFWMDTLILISGEVLRRVDALERARRAEGLALEGQRFATLGRYMIDMRPSVNNALTSILGNADLLLLEPGQGTGESREQLRTIHTMALRLNEVMQRFSSLAAEMRAGEKDSQTETESASHSLIGRH